MNEEVKKLGEQFRDKRKELSLSIKEVENSTSIRSNYLEAMEEGRIDQFISSVYFRGFIRQYATFLGFDTEKIIEEHPNIFKVPEEKHEFDYGIGTLEVRGSLGGGVKWLPSLLWGSVSAVILILAYFLAKYMGLF